MEELGRPARPGEAGAPAVGSARDNADGRQNFHLTRLVYTRYCHSGDLW